MIGEVRLFAGNFAPRYWAFCDGQLLPISQNQALFSILGTTYGGDGRTTFALPDLRGRVPLGQGGGPGLGIRGLGQAGGTETNTLTIAQLPAHNHNASGTVTPKAKDGSPNHANPGSNYPAALNLRGKAGYSDNPDTVMGPSPVNVTTENIGGFQPVNNMQPWLGLNFIICVQGIYPSRH